MRIVEDIFGDAEATVSIKENDNVDFDIDGLTMEQTLSLVIKLLNEPFFSSDIKATNGLHYEIYGVDLIVSTDTNKKEVQLHPKIRVKN